MIPEACKPGQAVIHRPRMGGERTGIVRWIGTQARCTVVYTDGRGRADGADNVPITELEPLDVVRERRV